MKWCICNKSSAIEAPIVIVDGEKRIYMSTHKYMVVEPAPVSYLFDEIDKTLHSYEELIQSGKVDLDARSEIKARWIRLKNRVRFQQSDEATLSRLEEQQALYREMDLAWKRINVCG
jgi:hypothetical protein